MRVFPWLGWAVALVLLAVLLWPKGPAPVDNGAALRAQNDSLRDEVFKRGFRIWELGVRLRMANESRDSAWKAQPPAETLYIGYRAQAATLDYRRMWDDMGRIPADTTARPVPSEGHP